MMAAVVIMSVVNLSAQEKVLTLKDINIRDPYIMPVEKEGVYYMYASSPTR